MIEAESVIEAKCKGCGGDLLFNPKSQTLTCEKCGSGQKIEETDFSPHPYIDGGEDNLSWTGLGRSFKCKSCGGEMNFSGGVITQVCPYCGSSYVSEIESLPGLKPDCVIPFAFDKREAGEKFKERVKKKAFIPNAFKKSPPESKIYSLYIPCFSFDAETSSVYSGVLEQDEVVRRGDKTYINTRSIPISGSISASLKNIVIEASQKMTQTQLQAISPYNHDKTKGFNDGYLRGCYVEHYSDGLDKSYEDAKKIMDGEIKSLILSRYRYDRVRYLNVKTQYLSPSYLYKLMPVYQFEYTYKNQKRLTCMNGQTGKLENNLPKSGMKIFGLVGGILLGMGLLFLIIMLLVK